MDRVGLLLNKLQELYNTDNEVPKLLIHAKMLVAELVMMKQATNISDKIAVVMPTYYAEVITIPEDALVEKLPEVLPNNLPVDEKIANAEINIEPIANNIPKGFGYEILNDIPTFSHQTKELFELNIALSDEKETLNDKLKIEQKEISTLLQDSPVKDLKKAIGVNDRYTFINELFRGDETMYERSIKTINAFNIYPEAEYWIQRELKLKMGWDNANEAVKQFDQLVRRRFS